MNKKDVAPILKELAEQYNFQKTPDFIITLQNLLAEVARIINDLLRRLRVPMPGDTNTSALADLLQIGLIVAGVLCVLLIAFLGFRRLNRMKALSQSAFKGAEEVEEELDSSGWMKRAEDLSSRQEWSKACRAVYLSVLYLLDENSILKYAPTRSNYEYWYALSRHKSLQKPFRELASLVDLIWFGEYKAGREDFKTCKNLSKVIAEDASSISLPKS